MKSYKFYNKKLIYLAAFLIPVIIMSFVFIIKGIVPFGNTALLNNDMLFQYTPFYAELSDRLKSGSSLLYSFNRGMGIDYISEGAYYFFSPLNILLVFFTNKTMPLAMSLLLMLKCGFAGLNMSIYLNNHFDLKHKRPTSQAAMLVAFSCCYALSSYMVNYYINIIWMDCLAIFPLIILSLEQLYKKEKPFLYSIYLCIAILSNFYIGYMICIFCIFYFLYLTITNYENGCIKKSLLCIARFLVYSLAAGAICAFVLIPTYFSLTATDAGGMKFYDNIETYYPVFVTFFRQMMSANPTYYHHPYLYCTDLVFLFLPIYFFNKNISLRERISKFVLYFIMIISFQINILDFIWNGFHLVNCFAGRQSFIFIFLVITMCTEVFLDKSYKNNKIVLISYIITICIFGVINQYFDFTSTYKCVIKNLIIVSIYLAILLTMTNKKYLPHILISVIFCEIAISAYERIDAGVAYKDYLSEINKTESAINKINDSGFYRIKNLSSKYKNDGSLYNYNSIATYSSMANTNLSSFMYKTGYPICLNAYGNTGSEPVFNNIFCEKYIISKNANLGTFNQKLIEKTDSSYIYLNPDALSIGFEVSDSIMESDVFYGSNPFERINSFAKSIAGCGEIYNIALPAENGRLTVESGNYLYLYSKHQLSESSFISSGLTEELYSDNNQSSTFLRNADEDNYVYYVSSSPNGGYITLPDNINPKDITAYTLNIDNYKILMDTLKSCQISISEFNDSVIKGSINCSHDGIIMTSIPYSEGWKVYVDKKEVKTFDIENALLAFKIETGEHTIKFSYIPKGFVTGCVISAIALCFLIISILYYGYNKKNLKR